VVVAAAGLGGCATVPPGAPAAAATNPADPWEAWNRKVFAFNDALDNAIVRPVAEGYRKVVPQIVRTGIGNVFGNIEDAWSTVNHLLQGRLQDGVEMGMRVAWNTVFGLGGAIDMASEMPGLGRRSEDFGQTLGRWGVPTGPYVVLPLFGPSDVRDGFAFFVDRAAASPSKLPETETGRYATTALELIDTRANLLSTTRLLGEVALDRYSFVRDGYLSRRLDQVHNGAPPLENFEDPDAPPPKK
jgi:phospholipid-binding lipoprotein MlaA